MTIDIETDRLVLRRFTTADLDALCDLDGDPEVMRYLSGGTPTPRAAIEYDILPRFLSLYTRFPGFGCWAAHERATGRFLGWLSLIPTERAGEAELGYRLRRDAWGRGFATEGARALMQRAFGELDLRRVVATTYQDNIASRRVMEKAGMSFVRAFRLSAADLAAQRTFDGTGQTPWDGDDVEYAIERMDWER